MPDDYDYQERAAILEYDGGMPRQWAEAFARLWTVEKPDIYNDDQWDRIIVDSVAVAGLLPRIIDNGWTPDDVRALIPKIHGRPIVAVGRGDVTLRMPAGTTERIYYRPNPGGVASWDEGRRAA